MPLSDSSTLYIYIYKPPSLSFSLSLSLYIYKTIKPCLHMWKQKGQNLKHHIFNSKFSLFA